MKKFLGYSWLIVLPMVAAAVIVWKASAAEPEQKCPEVDPLDHTVLLPNPADCSTFYSCSNGVPIRMNCPDGLEFNAELDVCDWPLYADCKKKTTTRVKYTCYSESISGKNGETYVKCTDCEDSEKGRIGTGTSSTCYRTIKEKEVTA